MVKKVLTGAGFVENETFKETRFLKPPKSTYAIYFDSFTGRGADGLNLLKDHAKDFLLCLKDVVRKVLRYVEVLLAFFTITVSSLDSVLPSS